MSSISKRRLAAFLIVVGTVAFLGVVHWVSEPVPSSAGDFPKKIENRQHGGAIPDVSIVFVIDSSQSMFPAVGPNYFDLARDGIVAFLDRPGFPKTGGKYEIGVVQFCKGSVRGYEEDRDWFHPVLLDDIDDANEEPLLAEAEWEWVRNLVQDLQPCGHTSGSLLEMGIHEATALLNESSATNKHIILLTTGEYRLPVPCPPPCYTDLCAPSCESSTGPQNDPWDPFCNRACHVRFFADVARDTEYRISTLRLGSDWHNRQRDDQFKESDPYSPDADYCPEALPDQPDRGGFMAELATCCQSEAGQPVPCTADIVGKTARINPFYGFGTGDPDFRSGTAADISGTIAKWLCDWGLSLDGDDDGILDLCDNCPQKSNERQRDCNHTGMGDVCEWTIDACGLETADTDCDGVPNGPDECEGGDDCLVRMWVQDLGCDETTKLNECGCDCDHDGQRDPCQVAKEIRGQTLPMSLDGWDTVDHDPRNGIADCCESQPPTCPCDPIPNACDRNGSAPTDFSSIIAFRKRNASIMPIYDG